LSVDAKHPLLTCARQHRG